MNKRYRIPILSILCIGIFLVGCSNTTPTLTTVEAIVVYDFVDKSSKPQQQFSVFVQSSADTARIMDLIIIHPELDIQWEVLSPVILSDGSRIMAGSAHLMPPYFSPIPQGRYSVNYVDLAGKTVTATFSLDYKDIEPLPLDEPIFSPQKEDGESETSAESGSNSGEKPIKRLALYSELDGKGQVLFFNELRSEWENFNSIKSNYDKAKSLRVCLDYPSSQVRYILPPVNF